MSGEFDPMAAADAMSQLIETVVGYRAQCEAAGFSPTAAEMMAMEFHNALIAQVFGPKGKK